MDVTDEDIENIRRISEEIFDDKEYLEVVEVKDTSGDVMVRVKAVEGLDTSLNTRNAFAGERLREFHDNGYVAVAVAGGNEKHSAWFERADTVEFGEPGPSGTYDLKDDWTATVGDNLVVRKDGDVVAHIDRDGWKLDRYPLYYVLPSHVESSLREHGFEQSAELQND